MGRMKDLATDREIMRSDAETNYRAYLARGQAARWQLVHLPTVYAGDTGEGWYLVAQYRADGELWEDAAGWPIVLGPIIGDDASGFEREDYARRVAGAITGLRFTGQADAVADGTYRIDGRS